MRCRLALLAVSAGALARPAPLKRDVDVVVNVGTIAVPTTILSTREVTKTALVVITSDEERITSTILSTVLETAHVVMTQTQYVTSTAQRTVVKGTTQDVTVQTTDYDVHMTTQQVWVPQTMTVTRSFQTVVTDDGETKTSVVKLKTVETTAVQTKKETDAQIAKTQVTVAPPAVTPTPLVEVNNGNINSNGNTAGAGATAAAEASAEASSNNENSVNVTMTDPSSGAESESEGMSTTTKWLVVGGAVIALAAIIGVIACVSSNNSSKTQSAAGATPSMTVVSGSTPAASTSAGGTTAHSTRKRGAVGDRRHGRYERLRREEEEDESSEASELSNDEGGYDRGAGAGTNRSRSARPARRGSRF